MYRKPYLFLFQTKPYDYSYPISELNSRPQESSMCPGNLIPISDQNMWFFLPYIRTELLSSRVQHVSWEPYSYFRSKYVIFPTLYQNWTAVLKSPACVLGTLFLFQIKICDFSYPISELNCFPQGSSMCPGNLIPISDQLTCTQGNIPPRVHLTYWIHSLTTELSPKTGGRGFPPVTIL